MGEIKSPFRRESCKMYISGGFRQPVRVFSKRCKGGGYRQVRGGSDRACVAGRSTPPRRVLGWRFMSK